MDHSQCILDRMNSDLRKRGVRPIPSQRYGRLARRMADTVLLQGVAD